MTDYKAMIEEHSCKPNQGCGVMTICMCGVSEDMADEIERLRTENQELKLQYLSDQGQWIEETGRLRDALSAMTELFKATEASAQVALSEIERLREALKQAGLYAWQGDTFKVMDIVRTALGEKE